MDKIRSTNPYANFANPPDPFVDTPPPPIPLRSPERVLPKRSRELTVPSDDTASDSLSAYPRPLVIESRRVSINPPEALYNRSQLPDKSQVVERDSDVSDDQGPEAQGTYSNPYSYGPSAEYGNRLIGRLSSGRKLSLNSTETEGEGMRSYQSSEIDPTYIHPLPQAILVGTSLTRGDILTERASEDPFADPREAHIMRNNIVNERAQTPLQEYDMTPDARLPIIAESMQKRSQDVHGKRIPSAKITSSKKHSDSSSKDKKLLKTAIRQNFLLEQERRNTMLKFNPEAPQPNPASTHGVRKNLGAQVTNSLSATRLIHSSPGDENSTAKPQGRKRTLRRTSFWTFAGLMVIGIGSTSATLILLFGGDTPREPTLAMVIWMICSFAALLLGITGCLCIWGLGKARFVNFMGRAGLEELGLMPSSFTKLRSRTAEEREAEKKRLETRIERIRERQKESSIRKSETMSSIRTLNAEWQALYASSENIRSDQNAKNSDERREREYELQVLLRNADQGTQRELRKYPVPQRDESWMTVDENDVSCGIITPTRVPPHQKNNVRPRSLITSFRERNQPVTPLHSPVALRRMQTSNGFDLPVSPKPAPLYSANSFRANKIINDSPFSNSHVDDGPPIEENTDVINRPTIERQISQKLSQDFRLTPTIEHERNIASRPYSHITHSPTVELYTQETQLSLQPDSTDPSISGTPVQTVSPLETLARELNTPELRSLSAEKRADYFSSRREISEECGRRVKESLDLKRMESVNRARGEDNSIAQNRNSFVERESNEVIEMRGLGIENSSGDDIMVRDNSTTSEVNDDETIFMHAENERANSTLPHDTDIVLEAKNDPKSAITTDPSHEHSTKSPAPTTEEASRTTPSHEQDISILSTYSTNTNIDPHDLPDTQSSQSHASTSQTSNPNQPTNSQVIPSHPTPPINPFLTIKATGPLITAKLRNLEQSVGDENAGRSGGSSGSLVITPVQNGVSNGGSGNGTNEISQGVNRKKSESALSFRGIDKGKGKEVIIGDERDDDEGRNGVKKMFGVVNAEKGEASGSRSAKGKGKEIENVMAGTWMML